MKIRGHESFPIRKGWLHKGIKNLIDDPRLFLDRDTNPSDTLGIGANMVKALRYWLYATKLIGNNRDDREEQLTEIAHIINENDMYFEEVGTNIILHYLLVTNINTATAWYWFFNEYEGREIDKEIFVAELSDYLTRNGETDERSEKVLADEFSCLIRTYCAKEEKEDDPDETKLCPLTELKLINLTDNKTKTYSKMALPIEYLNPYIALAIMINESGRKKGENIEIQFKDVFSNKNNLGKIFNLDRMSILSLLEKMSKMGLITISRTAGLDKIFIRNIRTFDEYVQEYYMSLGEVR